ncbi:MAG TPA: polyprenyl synthetase family protein [Candidatus Dormibacteraeota bacterium]|nr:polyprenyl synthetase family protein [Candidatus Dormibacteraeota bacterium]
MAAGGKRLRPALVLLAANLGSYDLDRVAPAAMAVEITHAATLVHDDVIDRAQLRRGRPTVAAAHGNEPAIVIGDYYLVQAYELASRTGSSEVVAVLARAVMEICAGEVRHHALRYRYAPDVDEYMRWIHDKTATLLAACCDIGGALGGLDGGARRALRGYGTQLGLAFQIADDVLDYTGSEDEVGKPIGHDLVEGFATLPLMLALERGAVEAIADGRHLTEDEARVVAERVRDSGVTETALARARELATHARAQIAELPETEASRTLASLTEYVVSRSF